MSGEQAEAANSSPKKRGVVCQHPYIAISTIVTIVISIGTAVGWSTSYGRLTQIVEQSSIDNKQDRVDIERLRDRIGNLEVTAMRREGQLESITDALRDIKQQLNQLNAAVLGVPLSPPLRAPSR